MQAIHLIFNCNQWKEYASGRLIAATTDIETMYAIIGGEIRAGNMDYDGETATVGFMKFKEDYMKCEINLSKLDYGMVIETSNVQVNEPQTLPEHCNDIIRLLIENESAQGLDTEIEEELEVDL